MVILLFYMLVPSPQGLARLSKKSRSQQLLTNLTQSRSQQPPISLVSKSLILDNHDFLEYRKVSVTTTTKFPVLDIFISLVHYILNNFQLSLGLSPEILGLILCLNIETMPKKVSVSVSTLRPVQKKSRSQS
jgi:hypothetical protein